MACNKMLYTLVYPPLPPLEKGGGKSRKLLEKGGKSRKLLEKKGKIRKLLEKKGKSRKLLPPLSKGRVGVGLKQRLLPIDSKFFHYLHPQVPRESVPYPLMEALYAH
jgi:hypothetical protein